MNLLALLTNEQIAAILEAGQEVILSGRREMAIGRVNDALAEAGIGRETTVVEKDKRMVIKLV